MKTYPSNNKRKIRKEEVHSPSLLRHALFPWGALALATALVAFCMVGGSARANLGYHSLFLKSDGSLHAMGYNANGQLGDGTTTTRNSPVQILASGVLRLSDNMPSADENNLNTLTFDDAWAVHGNGWNPGSYYSGVTLSGTYFGTVGGEGNGDPGNWNLNGNNGPVFLGVNSGIGSSQTFSFDEPIDYFSIGVGANGQNNYSLTAFSGNTEVASVTFTVTSAAWKKGELSSIGAFDKVTIKGVSGSSFAWGLDNIEYRDFSSSQNEAPEISQGVGPLTKTMAEDGMAVWTASDLNATDTDTNANSLTWSLSSAASNGTATVSGTGVSPSTITYAPNANFYGTDSFVVQVSDGDQNDTITVNVTVTSVNDVPIVENPLSDLSVTEDAANTTRGLANVFKDADNTTITKTSTSSNPSLVTAAVNGNTLILDYQANQSGTATITVMGTSNGQTVSDVFTVTVVPVADSPVITQGGIGEILTTVGGNSIAKINPTTGQSEVIGSMGVGGTHSAAFATDGSQTLYALIGNSKLGTVNLATGQATSVVNQGTGMSMLPLEIAPDGSIYGMGSNKILYRIDENNGSATSIGLTQVNAPMDLAFDSSGTLWATGSNKLWTVNTATGASTLKTSITGIQGGTVMGIMFDSKDVLYATSYVSNSPLYTINTASGAASIVAASTNLRQPHGGDFLDNPEYTLTLNEDQTIQSISATDLNATDSDTNASSLTWSLRSAANNGTATVSGTGASPSTFTYAPNANFYGTDSFVVQVSDGDQNDTITVNVTVTAIDDAPVVANALADLSASEDAADDTIALGNVFNDIDNENAFISKAATSSNASLVTATVNGNTLTLDYQANQSGTATITVTGTSNGQAVSDVLSVNVSPVDDAPVVANALANLNAGEDAGDATIDLGNVFNDLDDNNASITKTATSSNASLVTATVNGNTLTLDFQANQSGTAIITVTGTSNGEAVSDVFTVTIAPVDDAPVVANAIADLNAGEDAADAAIALGNLFNDVDDNNASISKTATTSNASLVTAAVNGNTLTLDYQANQSGTATITVTGTSNGQSVSDAFDVTISAVDDAPVVANALADLNAAEGAADATIDLGNLFNDIDDANTSITKTATSSNASLVTATVNGNTLTLDYQANQSGTATITVTGTSNGQSISDAFDVTISAVDDAPVVANAIADLSATEDAADVTIDLGKVFKDIDDDNASIAKAATSSNASLVTAAVNGNTLTLDFQANQSGTATITVTGTSNGQAVSDAFDITVDPVNDAPKNLTLSGDKVPENEPAGTIVGNFSATDVDANATLAFSLVDGNGSADNARFTLDADGVLKTSGSLDFEAGSSLSIRARVIDNAGSSQEKTFAISVTNVVEDLDGDAIEDAFDDDDDGDGFSDAEEAAYGSDPMDASSVANQAPSGIALSNSEIIENSPAGTKIGHFLVSDPDDPNDSYTYVVALTAGNGSADNNRFAIDSDGSLRTSVVLDFEANAEHSIRVRVSDQHGAFLDAVLQISAVNALAPIVRTLSPAISENGSITFQGAVLTDGGSPVTEVGVLTSDNLRFEGAVSLAATQSANFSVQASTLLPGSRYYVRAFATNAEGTTFGAIKRFYTQEQTSPPAPWWSDAKESAGGWRESDWFGTFIPYDNGWLYHVDLGWLYVVQDGKNGLWAWKKNSGWHWTSKGIFPHLYRNDTKSWLYFLASKEGQPYFYNHATGSVE